MNLTIRHYYPFGEQVSLVGESLLTAESWDNLRVSELDTPFSVPKDRAVWVAKCEASDFARRCAEDILSVVRYLGLNRVVSLGVGGAFAEYHLKKLAPSLHLTCTDYSRRLVARLREVFTECEVLYEFDLRATVWPTAEGLYLLHRIDADFTDSEWHSIFANMFVSNVEDVLFVSCDVLTPRAFFREKMQRAVSFFRGRPITFAGYLRTRGALQRLWTPHYRVERHLKIGGLCAFLLRKDSQQ